MKSGKNFTLKKNKFLVELISYFSFIGHGPHRKRRVQKWFYCCVCIRCYGEAFLPICCLAVYTERQTWEAFMKYAVLMRSGAMIPSYIKVSDGTYSKINGGIQRHHADAISLLLFPAYFPCFEIKQALNALSIFGLSDPTATFEAK